MSLSTVTSEVLQAKLRQLLPSQQGFGTDLTASDTIIPIIDLTETAEGSTLRQDLQTSFSLANATFTQTENTTNVIINNTGYYRIFGSAVFLAIGTVRISITDGTTTKTLYELSGTTGANFVENFDFIVFLEAGDSVSAVSTQPNTKINTTTRQLANLAGELV